MIAVNKNNQKFCPDCDKDLEVSKFKIKGMLKDGNPRFDKYCISHRRTRDRKAKKKQKLTFSVVSQLKTTNLPIINTSKLIEPEIIEDESVYDIAKFREMFCVESLTDQEIHESIKLINLFIHYLLNSTNAILTREQL